MMKAFEKSGGNLAERMLGALKAGREMGGDKRGERSAALLLMNREEVKIQLNVGHHISPIEELEKLLRFG
jgi:uncharacterized Ntn-hydrolase superfamily protein